MRPQRAYVPQGRVFNAVDLESAIVALGREREVVDAAGVPAALRAAALERAKLVKASEETWAMVVTFVCDRFGARSA